MQQALTALRGRVTVLAIAHRLSTIREADDIVVLNHGRIAEHGTHATLMAIEGGIYQRLVPLQQLVDEDEDEEEDKEEDDPEPDPPRAANADGRH